MKAHDRHDLKKNDLADTLGHIQRFFIEHGSKVLAVAVLVLVIIAAAFYFAHSSRMARIQAWEQLLAMQSGQNANFKPDDLRVLAQQTSDRQVAAFAWKALGDILSREHLTGGEKALASQAEQAYETVINNYPEFPLVSGGAKMGLGVLYEDTGRWDQAKQIYEQIRENQAFAGTGLPDLARARIENLPTWRQATQTPLPTSQPSTQSVTATRPAIK
ncbi:MAG: tetratricopeptide repeat protein [Phycisphaerae bacterium]